MKRFLKNRLRSALACLRGEAVLYGVKIVVDYKQQKIVMVHPDKGETLLVECNFHTQRAPSIDIVKSGIAINL